MVQTEISPAIIGWIAIKYCADIHVPQKVNSTDLGNPLTFHLALVPLAVCSEIEEDYFINSILGKFCFHSVFTHT